MQYEVRSVEPAVNDRSVLLEVAYWHSDAPGAVNGPPDYVEHHRLIDVPEQRLVPVRNRLGQHLGADGVLVNPWVEVDGEWQRVEFEPGDPRVQWAETPAPEAHVQAAVEQRARAVAARGLGLRGKPRSDLFAPGEGGRLPVTPPTHVLARRPEVALLRGRRGRV